jgi:beta-lactamase regulating signal transducer with metallopeptidase domain
VVTLVGFTPLPPAPPAQGVSWIGRLVPVWLAGVAGLSLRLIGGWIVLERLRRRATRPLPAALEDRCRRLRQRLGLARRVRFMQSSLVAVPVVIGWLRPVVLIPAAALTGLSPAQIDQIILHELAHVRRLDAFANLFQILVETLLFYHPAVWWVSRRIRIERENCCDDVAVGIAGDRLGYARALTLLEGGRDLPAAALASTGGSLKDRITRLLAPSERPSGLPQLVGAAAALVCLAASIAAGQAFTRELDPFAAPPAADASPGEPSPAPPEPAEPPEAPAKDHSYVGALAAAGLDHLTPDQLIALENMGVRADFVDGMRKAGFTPSVDDLMALHSLHVRPEDAAAFRSLGMNPLTVHDLLTLRALGVTPGYVRDLREAGLANLSPDDYATAKANGITPGFVEKLRSHGIVESDLGRLVALKATGLF